MSIYESWDDIGLTEDETPTGDVLAYRRSHVFPRPDDPTGVVSIASIPGHCVPGQKEDDFERKATYLRLDVSGHRDGFDPTTVILTENGALRLRNQLDQWLAMPKLDPAEGNTND